MTYFIRRLRLKSVPYFRGVVHVALRRPEAMRINHEDTKCMNVFFGLFFVHFVSSWLILIASGRRTATCTTPRKYGTDFSLSLRMKYGIWHIVKQTFRQSR